MGVFLFFEVFRRIRVFRKKISLETRENGVAVAGLAFLLLLGESAR
jgi:hypothetical protein